MLAAALLGHAQHQHSQPASDCQLYGIVNNNNKKAVFKSVGGRADGLVAKLAWVSLAEAPKKH
jgi:hypothetical protein